MKRRKSVSTGWRRATSYMSDEAKAGGPASRSVRTSSPLPPVVSYLSAGDDEPGLSKLRTTPTP